MPETQHPTWGSLAALRQRDTVAALRYEERYRRPDPYPPGYVPGGRRTGPVEFGVMDAEDAMWHTLDTEGIVTFG